MGKESRLSSPWIRESAYRTGLFPRPLFTLGFLIRVIYIFTSLICISDPQPPLLPSPIPDCVPRRVDDVSLSLYPPGRRPFFVRPLRRCCDGLVGRGFHHRFEGRLSLRRVGF